MEYNVVTTGNPPEEHNVTWARMEIIHVDGNEARVNVTTQARNGTISSLVMTLNTDKGEIGAWWIIPANLNPGQTFYDSFFNANITLNSEEKETLLGASRTVTNATVPTRTKLWDKTTGLFVVSMDNYSNYTIDVEAYATNMWETQILGLDASVFYAVTIIVVVVAVLVVGIVVWRKKQH